MGERLTINPWTRIWLHPRETIRAIIQYKPGYLFPLLCLIYGFPSALQVAQNSLAGDHSSFLTILLSAIIAGFVFGFLGIYLGAALYFWTGKLIGGTGSFKNIRTAVAWSSVPHVVSIVIWVVYMSVYGTSLFSGSLLQTTTLADLSLFNSGILIQWVMGLWSIVIVIQGLAEVQGFSGWRAFINWLLPFLVVAVLVFLVAMIITAASTVPAK